MVGTACSSAVSTHGSGPPSTFAPGSPWLGSLSAVTLPAPVNSLTALDCVDSLHCWSVGSSTGAAGAPNGAVVVATSDGGATWSVRSVPTTVGFLSGISCSDLRHCAAVGQTAPTSDGQGVIITTADAGSTWSSATIPAGILDVTAVACQPNRRCLATGTTATGTVALATAAGPSSWAQRGALPPTLTGATSISCPDVRHCWVTAHVAIDVDHVAGLVAVTTDGGGTWSSTAAPKGVGYLNDIVCGPGSGNGALPFTTTTAPTTTTPATPSATAPSSTPPSKGTPSATTSAVPSATTTSSLPSTSTTSAPTGVRGAWCAAVGTSDGTATGTRSGHGVVLTTTNGGATWSSETVPPSAAALMGVSCPSVDTCVAVGSAVGLEADAGVVVLTGPSDHPWKHATAAASPQALTAVSCTSTARCVMVGESISEHLAGG